MKLMYVLMDIKNDLIDIPITKGSLVIINLFLNSTPGAILTNHGQWPPKISRFCFASLVAVVLTNTNDGNNTILRMIKMTLPVFESFRPKLPACLCEKVALVQEARHHLVRWYQVP